MGSRAPQSLDVQGRITPLAYQRYVLSFTILRGLRLNRHGGAEAVREFVGLAEHKLNPTAAMRALIRGALHILT